MNTVKPLFAALLATAALMSGLVAMANHAEAEARSARVAALNTSSEMVVTDGATKVIVTAHRAA